MGPTPPPPQYSNLQHPGSASSTFASYPPPPNVGTDSTQYYSTGTTSSYPPPSAHHPSRYQDTPPHVTERNYGESGSDHFLTQRREMLYRKGPASHSSSSSCTSSSRDPYPPYQIRNIPAQNRRQYSGEGRHHDNFAPPPPFLGPGNRSLNGVMEKDGDTEPEDHYLRQQYSNSNQLQVTTRTLPANENLLNQQHAGVKIDSSDISTGSAKASCDSGLPPEETDPTVADPNAPLLSRPNPLLHHKSPIRTAISPRKLTWKMRLENLLNAKKYKEKKL